MNKIDVKISNNRRCYFTIQSSSCPPQSLYKLHVQPNWTVLRATCVNRLTTITTACLLFLLHLFLQSKWDTSELLWPYKYSKWILVSPLFWVKVGGALLRIYKAAKLPGMYMIARGLYCPAPKDEPKDRYVNQSVCTCPHSSERDITRQNRHKQLPVATQTGNMAIPLYSEVK